MKKRYKIEARCYDGKGRLISAAFNNYHKTHPLQKHFSTLAGEEKEYLHAEIAALLKAKDKEVVSITIINHNGRALPFPCKTCQQALKAYNVRYVNVQRTLVC